MSSVTLPPSGHAAWDDLATWWLSHFKPSTQLTYATYLPRWSRWCAGRRIDPLAARRAESGWSMFLVSIPAIAWFSAQGLGT
jgi:integrase/recombinase XerD